MEEVVDLILSCDIKDLKDMSFPHDKKFGLKVESKGVIHEFILNIKNSSDKLLVIGAGFIAKEKIETFIDRPVFSRISWKFKQSTLYYNDPTRNIDDVDLRGGWGIGSLDNWYLEEIAKIVKIISQKIYNYNPQNQYKNLMFYGSSMGGFMSLALATLVKNSVAIAEIPQFELRDMRTNWPPLEKQLFNGLSEEEIDKEYSYRLNIVDLIKKEKYIPNAYLLLDCSSKNDFNKQYKPFFDRLNELPYEENNNFNKIKIRVEGKNKGHHQMSQKELLDVINQVELLMDNKIANIPSKNIGVDENFNQLSAQEQRMLLKYFMGRIDIVNYGENSSIELIESSDSLLKIRDINWIDAKEGSGIAVHSLTGNLDLTVQCINNGKLSISLRSIYFKGVDNKIFPIYLDFNKFIVNNKVIINGSEVAWHNKPYRHTLKVKDKEIVKIHVEWSPFNKNSYFKK